MILEKLLKIAFKGGEVILEYLIVNPNTLIAVMLKHCVQLAGQPLYIAYELMKSRNDGSWTG